MRSIRVFFRNVQKQKSITVFTISSLAIGIAVAILIGLWGANELSFDRFHRNSDRIYRVEYGGTLNGVSLKVGSTFSGIGILMEERLPGIEKMCRVVNVEEAEVKIENLLQVGERLYIADSNFFTFFTFPLLEGDAQSCLAAPDNIVIDESTAVKYFPGQRAMGQLIAYRGKEYRVSAVMRNMPANSHLSANMVIRLERVLDNTGRYSDGYMTYMLAEEGIDMTGWGKKIVELSWEVVPDLKATPIEFYLNPLEEVHFSEGYQYDPTVKGNKSMVLIFLFAALVILIVAAINFVNLFVSTSFLRAKEIGVRKTHGAGKELLIRHFYTETLYYVLVSVGVGILLVNFMLPWFNQLAGSSVKIDWMDPLFYLFLGTLTVVMVFIAGTFPAFYMTKFSAVETLGGRFKGKNLSFLQKGLIVTQFTISIVFMISVFFIHKQVNYMVTKDLGFDKENIIYVYGKEGFMKNYESLREEFMQNPAIVDVTMKNCLPMTWQEGNIIRKDAEGAEDNMAEFCFVKFNYFDVMGMNIIEGENPFSMTHDSLRYCVINETMARILNLKNPVGEPLISGNLGKLIVKGVVKDAQVKSLHQANDPQVYVKITRNQAGFPIFFKVQGNPQVAIKAIQDKWMELEPEAPFDYEFLDRAYAHIYATETNAGRILGSVMAIMMVISIAGLFAMAHYATQRRMKEIGIRKVNGATIKELLIILNLDFVKWVGLSFVLACPVAYLFMHYWLEDFADRTGLSWWVFVVVGIISILVALLTVSWLTWKTAVTNPVKALKSE